jgi:hypothetical protein
MRINAHCFAESVRIENLPIRFAYKDVDVTISYNRREQTDGLMLHISRPLIPGELTVPISQQDDKGDFIARQLQPFTELLTEIAILLEGLMSVYYFASPPKFNPHELMVNINGDDEAEQELINSGQISGGFGVVLSSGEPNTYQWTDDIVTALPAAVAHLPAFSFLAQAIRSQTRHDDEVAFFLFFRILDGYFADGQSQVQKYLLKRKTDLKAIIPYDTELIQALENALIQLNLPSKSKQDFEGLLNDLVLIRHKLIHFSETRATSHFQITLNSELAVINSYLRVACTKLLREKVIIA